jgi:hypothetical protein
LIFGGGGGGGSLIQIQKRQQTHVEAIYRIKKVVKNIFIRICQIIARILSSIPKLIYLYLCTLRQLCLMPGDIKRNRAQITSN